MKTIRTHRRRAFTLIEVMIVIALVVALTGLVGVALLGRRDDAKVDLAKVDMNTLKSALTQFRFDHERWPSEAEGLAVLWDSEAFQPDEAATEADVDESSWRAYLDEPMASDRWGNEWGYRPVSEFGDESQYDLWSNGPDGEEGTDDDITNWSDEAGGAGGDFGDVLGGGGG